MKALVGLSLLGLLLGVGYWLTVHAHDDPGVPIPIAFGNASGDEIEMHVVVGVVMAAKDRMRDGQVKIKSWPEWIDDHFDLLDASGASLTLERQNNSKLIKPHEVPGTQEFFMVVRLRPGQDYTFDYIPIVGESLRYRYRFTAPAGPEKVHQYLFEPVK